MVRYPIYWLGIGWTLETFSRQLAVQNKCTIYARI